MYCNQVDYMCQENFMGILYTIATPIGNLEDITLRALRILKEVDFVVCEDTRHTLRLLQHYEIEQPLIAYHQHSGQQRVNHIIELLRGGKALALVTDAGTPGLSDPGGMLVEQAYNALGDEVQIIPIPGAAALTTVISAAGVPTDRFQFLGFLPNKKGRQTIMKNIAESKETTIFYESPYRIIKALEALVEVLDDERQVVVGRELTKKFETIYRGSAAEVLVKLQADKVKGEFVVIVAGK